MMPVCVFCHVIAHVSLSVHREVHDNWLPTRGLRTARRCTRGRCVLQAARPESISDNIATRQGSAI